MNGTFAAEWLQKRSTRGIFKLFDGIAIFFGNAALLYIMFLVVTPNEVRKKPRRTLHCRTVQLGDITYRTLGLPVYRGKPLWNGLFTDEPLIISEKLTVPQGFRVYPTDRWRRILCNTALQTALKKKRCKLTVYDKSGLFASELSDIAPAAASTNIITQNPIAYEKVVKHCYTQHGCYITVNAPAENDGIFYAPYETPQRTYGAASLSPQIVTDSNIFIPKPYCGLPADIPKLAVSEALFNANVLKVEQLLPLITATIEK